MVVAMRSVGLPTRIAGCSNEFKDGSWVNDDHHWVEFYSPNDASAAAAGTPNGPFSDGWHTKEGTSKGNAGGPWDAASGPMNGCLQGVVVGDDQATLWASKWSSDPFLPTMWHSGAQAEREAFVGGVNRCGAYCSAWG